MLDINNASPLSRSKEEEKNTNFLSFSIKTQTWISFVVLTIAWGSSFMLVKRGLQSFSPWQVASIRLTAAMSVFLPFALRYFKEIPKSQLPYIVLSGLLSMCIPAFLFCAAQIGLSSSIVSVLNALTPAFTFLVGVFFYQQKSKMMQIVGLTIGFIGSALLIFINPKGEITINFSAFYVVVATILYGINVNMVKRYLPDVKPLHLTSVAVTASGLLALPYLLSTDWLTVLNTAPKGKESFIAAVALGVISTAFAQFIFNRMLQYSTAVFASSITYFIPIVAVMWGVLDGEILLPLHFLGMACIIGGILILNKFR
jgi:drug/metabolite transporter (DMT)-like permease